MDYLQFATNPVRPSPTFPLTSPELRDSIRLAEHLGIDTSPPSEVLFILGFVSSASRIMLKCLIADNIVWSDGSYHYGDLVFGVDNMIVQGKDSKGALVSQNTKKDENVNCQGARLILDVEDLILRRHVDVLAGYGMALELATCEAFSPLTRKNIANYKKAVGMNFSIAGMDAMIRFRAASISTDSSMEAVRIRGETFKFVKYHTTFSSTHGLLSKFFDEMPQEILDGIELIGWVKSFDDCKNKVDNLVKVNGRLDALAAIPDSLILQVYCYLDSVDRLPERWYTGERVYESTPPSTVVRVEAFYDKLAELTGDKPDLDSITTFADLIGAFHSRG